MTINYERRDLPPYPGDDPTGGYARLRAAIQADEEQRRTKVEELIRAAFKWGYSHARAGLAEPSRIDVTWGEVGNARVYMHDDL